MGAIKAVSTIVALPSSSLPDQVPVDLIEDPVCQVALLEQTTELEQARRVQCRLVRQIDSDEAPNGLAMVIRILLPSSDRQKRGSSVGTSDGHGVTTSISAGNRSRPVCFSLAPYGVKKTDPRQSGSVAVFQSTGKTQSIADQGRKRSWNSGTPMKAARTCSWDTPCSILSIQKSKPALSGVRPSRPV